MVSAMRQFDAASTPDPAELIASQEPFALRGVAAHWPVVIAARNGPQAALDYLDQCLGDHPIEFALAPPSEGGRFHYNQTMTGFNFERRRTTLRGLAAMLRTAMADPAPPAIAGQGILAEQAAPRFAADNPLPLRPGAGEARLWLCNRARVAAHSDPAGNIAYCAAGRRRFTLFPPEQLGNLYLGPFDPTPGGTPIAMTDPLEPDFERFPRFAEAMDAALDVLLEPGDAIFVPYGWYHHVEALDPVSLLVNYWWLEPETGGGSPWEAMLHGMMALRSMSPEARRHWMAMFRHYVFEEQGHAGAHLPPHARGVLDARAPQDLQAMRAALKRNLG